MCYAFFIRNLFRAAGAGDPVVWGLDILSFLRYAYGAAYGRFWNHLKEVAAQEGRSAPGLAVKFLGCFLRYGCGLSDYLNYELWNKTPAQRREYVTIRDSDAFYARVSPAAHKTFFTVKPNFLVNFAPYIHRDFFVPQEGNLAELESYLRGKEAVMVKPVDGLGGQGVHKAYTAQLGDLAAFHRQLLEERLFLEDVIVQHPAMAALCPNSVNTIRVMTVRAGDRAELLYAGVRIGAGSDVDNFHAGGMGVGVDLDTGTLQGDAINKDREVFHAHPITGTVFDGYALPMWDEVKRMCLEASAVNPYIHVVGWDVALTPDGPTFVEGNRRPGFDLPQMTSKRGRQDILRRVDALLKEAEA